MVAWPKVNHIILRKLRSHIALASEFQSYGIAVEITNLATLGKGEKTKKDSEIFH